jgi:hypothetical protein
MAILNTQDISKVEHEKMLRKFLNPWVNESSLKLLNVLYYYVIITLLKKVKTTLALRQSTLTNFSSTLKEK